MYIQFYGFTKEPFQNTPDIDFLFLSPNHKEALACIEYGIDNVKGSSRSLARWESVKP